MAGQVCPRQGGFTMLVLTRKVGEKIFLGSDIVVTVTSISGQQVRLGITAPASVPILRNELVLRDQSAAEGPAEADGKRARPLRMFRPRVQEPV
jgi:carbon storage regulator